MSLADWLLERVAEDEEAARRQKAHEDSQEWRGESFVPFYAGSSARVLAECDAKRRIVELAWHHFGDTEFAGGMEYAKEQVLRLLAIPYSSHPDYKPEWRV